MNISKIGIIGILAIICLTVVISGCTSDTDSSNQTESTNTGDADAQSSTSSFKPINLSGTGDEATSNFDWPGGLMRLKMTHNGSSNFAIWLYEVSSGSKELVVNEIGSYDASRAFNIPAGTYMLDVSADGPWTVDISQ
ncbi:MAG: hypothetical protein U1C19_04960 [Methanobacteriaceae archaeon]|nr:hypothetical protein [Methanobacteriaceae archaeon]